MDPATLDQVLDDHYMYEATDDVDGVVSTVTDDVKHYVTGSPLGELTGKEAARAFYAELFKDFRGEGVEPIARWHGDNFVVDEIIVRREALLFRMEVRDLHCFAVAAAG